MAKVTVILQSRQTGVSKGQVRGVFTQKKKLWTALEELAGSMAGKFIIDDVTEKEYDASYKSLCDRLRTVGRATILDVNKIREFLVVETNMNEARDWDTGDDGIPRLNPAKGADDDEKTV